MSTINYSFFIKFGLILFFIFLHFIEKIFLITSDLGRHITNGQLIFENNFSILYQNTYSYTNTEFPVINHHWLFGVYSYLIEKLFGFGGLTILNGLLIVAGVVLIFLSIFIKNKKLSISNYFLLALIFLMPMIIDRNEIRPETFSFLFFSLIIFLFTKIQNGFQIANHDEKFSLLKNKNVYLLLFLQIVWVNTHIFFILSILLSGYYFLINYLENQQIGKNNLAPNFYLKLTILLIVFSFINPNGIEGFFTPFLIFQNYEYRVAENQSTFTLIDFGIKEGRFTYYIIFSIILMLLNSLFFIKEKKYKKISEWIIFLTGLAFLLAGNKVIRFAPFMAVFLLPTLAEILQKSHQLITTKLDKKILNSITSIAGLFFLFSVINYKIIGFDFYMFGLGLVEKSDASAKYFIENKLSGNVYNNYDIGGYLIYYLYRNNNTLKVYTDNRPEAYPKGFFTEYLNAQSSTENWQKLDDKYNFDIIYFFIHDKTDNAQKFLIERSKDPNWKIVYSDDYTVIMRKIKASNTNNLN